MTTGRSTITASDHQQKVGRSPVTIQLLLIALCVLIFTQGSQLHAGQAADTFKEESEFNPLEAKTAKGGNWWYDVPFRDYMAKRSKTGQHYRLKEVMPK